MGFVVGKCGFKQDSMGCLIEIRKIPDDSSVDSLDLGSEVREVDDSFQILEEDIVMDKREKLSRVSISVFFSIVIDFNSLLTVLSQSRLLRLVHNENNCRLVFLEI